MAGKGGFNIAHQMDPEELYQKYTPTHFLKKAIQNFGVAELRSWYLAIGIPTFVGTSGRVFPEKGISPADVLRTIKKKLQVQNVTVKTAHSFVGFTEESIPLIRYQKETFPVEADIYIFCLGGGSWKVTGANSEWLSHFEKLGVSTLPFQASNCGLNIAWPRHIQEYHIGKPLKNIAIYHQELKVKGEAVISNYGIEGNAVYPISSSVRTALNDHKCPHISIDFKPNQTEEELLEKIKHLKPSNYAKGLKLDVACASLLKSFTAKEQFIDPKEYCRSVKKLNIPIESLRPVEEAISTVGGIETDQLNPNFSLKNHSHIYCIGEMVSWDAPTGGFLLQGCFSMGAQLANGLLEHQKAN